MTQRNLHLACYDIGNHRRLAQALKLARSFATGGQKSVHEVLLTPTESAGFVADMRQLLDEQADRFLLVRIDPRCSILTLGKARQHIQTNFFCIN